MRFARQIDRQEKASLKTERRRYLRTNAETLAELRRQCLENDGGTVELEGWQCRWSEAKKDFEYRPPDDFPGLDKLDEKRQAKAS